MRQDQARLCRCPILIHWAALNRGSSSQDEHASGFQKPCNLEKRCTQFIR